MSTIHRKPLRVQCQLDIYRLWYYSDFLSLWAESLEILKISHNWAKLAKSWSMPILVPLKKALLGSPLNHLTSSACYQSQKTIYWRFLGYLKELSITIESLGIAEGGRGKRLNDIISPKVLFICLFKRSLYCGLFSCALFEWFSVLAFI